MVPNKEISIYKYIYVRNKTSRVRHNHSEESKSGKEKKPMVPNKAKHTGKQRREEKGKEKKEKIKKDVSQKRKGDKKTQQ